MSIFAASLVAVASPCRHLVQEGCAHFALDSSRRHKDQDTPSQWPNAWNNWEQPGLLGVSSLSKLFYSCFHTTAPFRSGEVLQTLQTNWWSAGVSVVFAYHIFLPQHMGLRFELAV